MVKDAATGEPVRVKMHPGSVSADEKTYSSPYIVYQELVSTTQLYIRGVTPVPPLALAFFGGPLASDSQKGIGSKGALVVDGWIKLEVPPHLKDPILEIRRRLDALFSNWVAERGQWTEQSVMHDLGGTELLK